MPIAAGTVEVLAGAGAGGVACVVCAPLDVLKTKRQAQGPVSPAHSRYRGLWGSGRVVLEEEGFRGFFRGIGPSLATVPTFWALYFPLYHVLHRRVESFVSGSASGTAGSSPMLTSCVAAASAGVVVEVVTNPMWVVRTRMVTDTLHGRQPGQRRAGMLQTFRGIVSVEGPSALYRGLSASLLGVSHVAVQFPVYEAMKRRARERNADGREEVADLVAAAITSKVTASGLTYPHEVVRTQMQDSRVPISILESCRRILRTEGWRGFYQGIGINFIRVVPSCVTTFVCFELIRRALHGQEAASAPATMPARDANDRPAA